MPPLPQRGSEPPTKLTQNWSKDRRFLTWRKFNFSLSSGFCSRVWSRSWSLSCHFTPILTPSLSLEYKKMSQLISGQDGFRKVEGRWDEKNDPCLFEAPALQVSRCKLQAGSRWAAGGLNESEWHRYRRDQQGKHPVQTLLAGLHPCFSVCWPGFSHCRDMEAEIHPGTDKWPEGFGKVAPASDSILDVVSASWSFALSFSLRLPVASARISEFSF